MDKYYIVTNNSQQGPFTLDELKNKTLTPKTLIWTPRLGNWTEAQYIDELKNVIQFAPPPFPPNTIITPPKPEDNFTKRILYDDTRMFQNPFSFEGRVRRTEFGISYIIFFIYYVLFRALLREDQTNGTALTIMLILLIPFLWFHWAQGAKRCHDLGNNGWWQLIPFYMLWLLFENSLDGMNEYGANPKGRGNYMDNF